MKLFDGIIRAFRGGSGSQSQSSYPTPTFRVSFSGDHEYQVYVYYGWPLKTLHVGDVFNAEVITSPMLLKSDLTGGIWDTGKEGIALAYKGRVFGATAVLDETFKELSGIGYEITVSCKMTGWFASGIPEIVMKIEDRDEIIDWRYACRGLGYEVLFEDRHHPTCEALASAERDRRRLSRLCGRDLPGGIDGEVIYFPEDKWEGQKPTTGCLAIDVVTELIPQPQGSKAKPHIAFVTGKRKVAEVSARNRQYKMLSKHIGEKPYFACCRKYTGNNRAPLWMVIVTYLG